MAVAMAARASLRNKILFAKNQAETARIQTKRIQERYNIKKQILKERKEKHSK